MATTELQTSVELESEITTARNWVPVSWHVHGKGYMIQSLDGGEGDKLLHLFSFTL